MRFTLQQGYNNNDDQTVIVPRLHLSIERTVNSNFNLLRRDIHEDPVLCGKSYSS